MSQAAILVDSSAAIASLGDANVIPVLVSATTGTGTAIAAQIPLSQLATFFESTDAPIVIDSNSAAAFAVGPNGATNPVFVIDASTASQAAGLKLTGAVADGSVAVAVISSGSNANLTIDAKGTGTVTIGATSTGNVVLGDAFTVTSAGAVTGVTTFAASTSVTVTSASASALAVGLAGATNPAFVVDSSTGSQAAGLSVTGATAAGNVAVAVISSGAAANLIVNAKGTGTIGIGTVSTGAVSIVPILGATLKCMVGTTAGASINFGNGGAAPTSPNDGDAWIESNTLKLRLNGATVTVQTA